MKSVTLADVIAAGPACAGLPVDEFYLESYVQVARATCADCPALELCREYAIVAGEPFGTWGGLTAEQRQTARRRRGLRVTRFHADAVVASDEARCGSCRLLKPRSQFNRHTSRPNGLSGWCRDCAAARKPAPSQVRRTA